VIGNQKEDKVVPSTGSILESSPSPKFFQQTTGQVYYSEVPPPGSIFTFDDDKVKPANRLRQSDDESEEDDDEEEDDEGSSEEEEEEDERLSPPRPPLSFAKATAPSGEDDEADSLGVRPGSLGRMYVDERYIDFPYSRGGQSQSRVVYVVPYSSLINYIQGNSYERPQYQSQQQRPYYKPQSQQQRPYYKPQQQQRPYRPQQQQRPYYKPQQQYQENAFYSRPEEQQTYYYRPAEETPTKVIPLANFDVNLERDEESGEYRPVLSPVYYQKTTQNKRPVVIKNKRPQSQTIQHQQNLSQIFSKFSPTPVIRQRSSHKHRQLVAKRQAKQLKKEKKAKKALKKQQDPLGILSNKTYKVVVKKNN
jgi:hypothetical protein